MTGRLGAAVAAHAAVNASILAFRLADFDPWLWLGGSASGLVALLASLAVTIAFLTTSFRLGRVARP